jgi:hypothetical protein
MSEREGWGATARSKFSHYFREERTVCSGSAPVPGPLSSPLALEKPLCPDCLKRVRNRQERLRSGKPEIESTRGRIGSKIGLIFRPENRPRFDNVSRLKFFALFRPRKPHSREGRSA